MEIAAALLAGVLAQFGLQAFAAAQTALPLVLTMLLVYLLARRLAPRYAVVITLVAAVACVALRGQMAWSAVRLELAMPVFTAPQFSLAAIVSLALPLLVLVRYRLAGERRVRAVCIPGVALAPDQHRRLRVRLKFSRRRWLAPE